jgi:hypothetical protein
MSEAGCPRAARLSRDCNQAVSGGGEGAVAWGCGRVRGAVAEGGELWQRRGAVTEGSRGGGGYGCALEEANRK